MKSLMGQFDDKILEAFNLHEKILNKIDDELRENRHQQAALTTLISDYRHKDDLIEHILEQLGKGAFKEGDNAKTFFFQCADQLFFKNLNAAPHRKAGEDQYTRMKELHPLWGESIFST